MKKDNTDTGGIIIRPVRSPADCRHVQLLQQRVWASGDRDLVPAHVLITIAKNGGVLLGAFAPDGPHKTGGMVGFVLGWPGYGTDDHGRPIPKHCSHQVAVLPEYQRRGLGQAIKLAQREAILAQGITEWVTWTFDPLQRINAVFNLHRLGATSNTYLCNTYGELEDALNVGLPTDRLQVDWWLRSPRVVAATAPEQATHTWPLEELRIMSAPDSGEANAPDISGLRAVDPLAVPIPETVNQLRTKAPARMSHWRYYLRAVLPTAFERGYILTDCVDLPSIGWHYILSPI